MIIRPALRGPFGFMGLLFVAALMLDLGERALNRDKSLGNSMPADIHFYHLQMQPLEAALPLLLEKCLERGWSAFIQTGSEERADALDSHLWSWREDSFLAHGLAKSAFADRQPILISAEPVRAENGAHVRFFVDGARPEEDISLLDGLERAILMFDGGSDEALHAARQSWKALKDASFPVTYWQQTARGGWDKKD
ncbi:DNA polymerase III subunit chi [uncultured Cohaesibacter sp.]|uniref:DNA polymerase III subunit chi n=1 Tax=uncultured Cohaesibacter sp. TaxID=1002546 RepID=UPI0029C6CFCD|nr:DNA polymerase III subunit chi [uncultured Cohaesibacter sp.]